MGCLSSHIHNCKMFDLNNITSSADMYFQDCAGVILCAAERGTQVALQVKEHSHSFVYEFQSFMFGRSIEIEWFCTALKEPEIVVVNCTYPFHPLGFYFQPNIAPGHLNHHFYSCNDEKLWTTDSSASSQMRAKSNPERITDLYVMQFLCFLIFQNWLPFQIHFCRLYNV